MGNSEVKRSTLKVYWLVNEDKPKVKEKKKLTKPIVCECKTQKKGVLRFYDQV